MKLFRMMMYLLALIFLVPVTTSAGPAAEGWGYLSLQGKAHAADNRDRGERNDRGERQNRVQRQDHPQPQNRVQRQDHPQPQNRVQRQDHPQPQNRVQPQVYGEHQDRGERHDRDDYRNDRNRGWQKGFVLDKRYGHNYYYPPRGHVVRSLPRGYRTYHYHGGSYYYMHGIWYRHSGVSFVVVAPPLGIVVPILPPYYTTVWVGGIPYYYAGGIYYVWRPAMQGYVVSEAPAESNVETEQVDSGQFYVYPKQGQSPDQQAQDRYECHRWAVDQTGFDPSQPKSGMTASELVSKRGEYRRAIMACLEARGYSVK